jgi:hypothetical protein
MAAEPILKLRDALVPRLNTLLSAAIGSPITVEKRYAPYLDPADLQSPRWLAVLNSDTVDQQLRGLAPGELAIDVALQVALTAITDRDDDFISTTQCDEWVEMVGKLKSLFRPGGVLRSEPLVGCDFRRYTNAPLFRPELLVAHGIFVSVVTLIYYFDHPDD